MDAGDFEGVASLGFGAVDEYGGWYDDAVDVSAASVAPDA